MWFEWSGVGSLFLVHMPALQNMPTICNHNLQDQHHHGASSYINIPWLHRYHPSANTPPPPLILTSTIYRARAILQFRRDWWLGCNKQPLFSLPLSSKPLCKKWCTITIHHRLGVLHQWITVIESPITSDISIGPLRGRAWSLVQSTRRTTSTHHPLQVLTNGSWRGSEDRS